MVIYTNNNEINIYAKNNGNNYNNHDTHYHNKNSYYLI